MATFALGLQMGRNVIEQWVSRLYLLWTAKDLLSRHYFAREVIFVEDFVLALGECGDGEYQPAFIGVVLLFGADAGLLKLSRVLEVPEELVHEHELAWRRDAHSEHDLILVEIEDRVQLDRLQLGLRHVFAGLLGQELAVSHQELPVSGHALEGQQLIGCTSVCHVMGTTLKGR